MFGYQIAAILLPWGELSSKTRAAVRTGGAADLRDFGIPFRIA
jgi:hypothetical protein